MSAETRIVPITPAEDYPGLSSGDVRARIERGETNDYRARVSRTYWDIVRDNLLNLFNIVLGTLLVIVIASGDYATAFFAGFSVVTNTCLGMIQEINAKRKLDQLAALAEAQVVVWRDGARQQISMREVVLDDVLFVEPGDRVVVDGVVLHSDSLEIDESLLTGESDAVFKEPGAEVFSGSFCTAGSGRFRATRVGRDSNINRLSVIAKEYKNIKTPTQTFIDIIVEVTVVIMFVFVPMMLVRDLIINQITFLDGIRNAVVFVTSLVPQGLVLVAILSLTIGAIKISRHQTLVQKVNAVESLANATVLCFDKTGTLTKNALRVQEIIAIDHASNDRASIEARLADYLDHLSHRNRTAAAIYEHVAEHLPAQPSRKVREVPFTSGRKWGAVVFEHNIYVLGAPERILTPGADATSLRRAQELSKQGMRVLAFASLTKMPEDLDIRGHCQPIALIVMGDTIREDIADTLSAFRAEGIDLKVISGDNLETVSAIAQEAGMTITGACTGDELDAMPDSELDARVEEANVFARIEPHTKQRIVSALQRQKHYVAMVGDGVNDVPALKQANLAIVMNDGTQISKDVADIVLLNNAMSTLPRAFHEGKEITQTIFGTMKMFLIKNFYNVALFVFIAFMGLAFPITPVQISWITFGTVNLPATLIAFGILRPQTMRNFRDDVLDAIFTGGFIGAIALAILYVIVYFGTGRDLVATRSAITLYLAFYGAYIVCSIQGVSFYDPRSFIRHWRTVVMMIVLTALTCWAMYIYPSLFEFRVFTWEEHSWVFITLYALLALSMILLAHGERYRYLLRRLWHLFRPPDRDAG